MEITSEFESCQQSRHFFGQTIHYLFSLSIHILRAQTEYESRERRPLMGFTPPPPPFRFLSLLFQLCLLYQRALALTVPLNLTLPLALRQLENKKSRLTHTKLPHFLSLSLSSSISLSGVMSCCETVKSLEATLDWRPRNGKVADKVSIA